jgi:hypothetical protein
MSRLYSSPEVTSVEVTSPEVTSLGKLQASDCRYRRRFAHCGTRHARRIAIAAHFQFHKDFVVRRVQQRRVPQPPALVAGRIKSFSLPNKPILPSAGIFRVIFQAQYQAFVRFAVGSSAALSAIALNWTCVLEPFTPGGLSLRELWPSPVISLRGIYGAINPGPML